VRTYDGELTTAELAAALDWAARPRAPSPPLEALAWPAIARRTLAAYASAGGG
jgi:hypothetical protein